jgi:hypothetical protein
VFFSHERYLTLEQLLDLWSRLRQIGATQLPRSFGDMRIDVPEQHFWAKAGEPSAVSGSDDRPTCIEAEGTKLTVQCGANGWTYGGAVEAVYTGSRFYYRAALWGSKGYKVLHQQVVIQDGGRHIVITGSGTAMIRAELVPKLEALVKQLPGMPGEHNDRASA